MVAHLVVSRPGGPEFVVLSEPAMSLGRGRANDVVIAEDSVSRLHAALEARSGGWAVRDLGSRNGTFVNGERVLGDRALRDGDEIRIGITRLTFRPDSELEQYSQTLTADPPPSLTRRERDVLLALFRTGETANVFVEPASTRQIAEALFVTEAAVKQHLINLYEKFEIRTGGERRIQLANEALRRGSISFSEIRGTVV